MYVSLTSRNKQILGTLQKHFKTDSLPVNKNMISLNPEIIGAGVYCGLKNISVLPTHSDVSKFNLMPIESKGPI